jgi:hypothetical protein
MNFKMKNLIKLTSSILHMILTNLKKVMTKISLHKVLIQIFQKCL